MPLDVANVKITQKTSCYHCGDICEKNHIHYDEKSFCCQGCQAVYAILADNSMTDYYKWLEKNGQKDKKTTKDFDFLQVAEIQEKIYTFKDEHIAKAILYLPTMHCSACVWLLENLYKINPHITYSRIDFQNKELTITFLHQKTSLLAIVKLLSELGYTPHFTLENLSHDTPVLNPIIAQERILLGKIAVAGFCAGNIMMTSFPEYFGFDSHSEDSFKLFFQYVNVLLILPAFFYSGFGYIISAYQSLKKGFLHLDFPLALGIVVLFLRSFYEIFTKTGAGYLDTLSGLIFFLLLGKWIQHRTYFVLRYDRDFRAYFPITITQIQNTGKENAIMLSDLKKGDVILVKNNELIPADATLHEEYAHIDYSFVTGESKPTHKKKNDLIYAGGRNSGQNIRLEVVKEVAQSYLTSLWNNEIFCKKNQPKNQLQDVLAKYFILCLLVIASIGFLFWGFLHGWVMAINIFTAVLVVGCPCALTLSAPFALGTAISILGKYGIFLKNTSIIENIAQVDTLIFDKTGTLTQHEEADIHFKPLSRPITQEEGLLFWALSKNSIHPVSQHIASYFKTQLQECEYAYQCNPTHSLNGFEEQKSKGILGVFGGNVYKIGNIEWVKNGLTTTNEYTRQQHSHTSGTISYLAINDEILAQFVIYPQYRKDLAHTINQLKHQYPLFLISGDNAHEKQKLNAFFDDDKMFFGQSPHQKQNFVATLAKNEHKTMMLGDGLNDARALQQATVGIAITDQMAYFTPASDAIVEGASLEKLPFLLSFSKKCVEIIKSIFFLSLFYNAFVLTIALTGNLSPLILAILMPISSLSFIVLATLWVEYTHKTLLQKNK